VPCVGVEAPDRPASSSARLRTGQARRLRGRGRPACARRSSTHNRVRNNLTMHPTTASRRSPTWGCGPTHGATRRIESDISVEDTADRVKPRCTGISGGMPGLFFVSRSFPSINTERMMGHAQQYGNHFRRLRPGYSGSRHGRPGKDSDDDRAVRRPLHHAYLHELHPPEDDMQLAGSLPGHRFRSATRCSR
jgi:hypothetical protein